MCSLSNLRFQCLMYYVHYLNVTWVLVQLAVDKLYQGAPEFLCAANLGKGGLNKA